MAQPTKMIPSKRSRNICQPLVVQIVVILLQSATYIGDRIFFPKNPLFPWIPVVEALVPYLFIPVFRTTARRTKDRGFFGDVKILGRYLRILTFVTLTALMAFQVVNWIYDGKLHGGIFYFGGFVAAFRWGFTEPQAK